MALNANMYNSLLDRITALEERVAALERAVGPDEPPVTRRELGELRLEMRALGQSVEQALSQRKRRG